MPPSRYPPPRRYDRAFGPTWGYGPEPRPPSRAATCWSRSSGTACR